MKLAFNGRVEGLTEWEASQGLLEDFSVQQGNKEFEETVDTDPLRDHFRASFCNEPVS